MFAEADHAVLDLEGERRIADVASKNVLNVDDRGGGNRPGGQPGPIGDVAAVEDDHEVADVAAWVAGREVAAALEVVGEQLVELGHRSGHEPQPPDGVLAVRVQRVREPLEPVPLTTTIGRDARGDDQLVGRVEGGEMGDDGPDVRPNLGEVTVVADLREAPQPDRHRQLGHRVVGADEPSQGTGAHRVEVGDRLGLRGNQLQRKALRATRDPDVGEVVVARPAFPQPPCQRDRGQRVRARVAPHERFALPGRGHPYPVAELVQVTHVVASGGVDLAFAVGLFVAGLAE